MGSLLFQVFSCCIRPRSGSPGEPDENTPFLRPNNDESPSAQGPAVDHQKMKERLGTIVRSKEGKMVNVNAPLPFNLHNRALHARLDLSTSRSGRSSSVNESTRPPDPDADPAGHGLPLDSQYHDPEHSPSLQTSHSTTSLHPGDASYLPPEADPDNAVRRPVLSVRLVRVAGGYGIGGRMGRASTRGRRGRFGEERGEPLATGAQGSERVEDQTSSGAANEGAEADTNVAQSPAIKTPTSLYADGEQGHSSEETTPLATEFQILDVGKISRSWGD